MTPAAFYGVAAVVLGILAILLWRSWHRWSKLETLLEHWSAAPGSAPTEEALRQFGEAGRLLGKVGEREVSLSREAVDAQFNLRAILAGMEDGVLVADRHQRITFVNPALVQIFEIKGEPVGQTVLSTLRLPILQTMVQGVLEECSPQQAELEPIALGREEPAQLVVSAAPLREASGSPGVLMVFRDVSRLRRLEEVRREFVANVSHELRTPLSIFHGYLENLIDSPEPAAEEVRSSLLVMRRHALRLNALVEDLLALARLESNRDQLLLTPVSLLSFLHETQADWEPKASAKQIRIELHVPDALPDISADVLKLQQVLGNLLDNAVKYTPPGGTVMLRAASIEEEGVSWQELRVEDSGPGVTREDLPHIFQRFYRADKARSREMGGTGLGLAIVKHIMQAHGGSVGAESELGKGMRIILRFPVNRT